MGSAAHCPDTTGEAPAGMGAHRPGLVGTLQARHNPAQALLQHSPSTQKPEAH
jgi:hypothetical protein